MRDDYGVHVHLFEQRAFIFDLPPGHRFESRGQFFYALSPVSFDDADHHVFTVATAANAFAEHGVGLADARRIPQEKLERSLGFLAGRALLEPLFGFLGHGSRYLFGARRATVE